MNDNHEMRIAIIELSRKFEARYEQYWIKSNDVLDRDDLRERMELWIVELTNENISVQTIRNTVELTLKSIEFSKYPPILNKFISLCRETNKMFSNGDEGEIYLSVKRVDEAFEHTYGHLWTYKNQDKTARRISLWAKELSVDNVCGATVRKTLSAIRKNPSYILYPPTMNQFILECKFNSIGEVFISPDIAFVDCRSGEKNLHEVIKTTKRKIGSHTLKIATDNHIKSLFEKIYLTECIKYVDAPMEYIEKNMLKVQGEAAGEATGFATDNTISDTQKNKTVDFFDSLSKKH